MADRQLIASVHDVMPATLEKTERIVERLQAADIATVTLLVVPDTGWEASSLERLRRLVSHGCELAGHGWRHKADHIEGLAHRLHSALASRDVAEHLALDTDGIRHLVRNCYHWFAQHELPPPALYVPPAWAMGSIRKSELAGLSFRYFEYVHGVYDAVEARFQRLPMIGYEADTAFRAAACRIWNGWNLATAGQKPVRLAIHPHDFELRVADDLAAFIDAGGQALAYDDV